MGNIIARTEFNVLSGSFFITCVDYRWCHDANPEGSIVPEAGIKNTKTGEFALCQHGMNHERAVAMIVNCLEHGVSHYETCCHVQEVGTRYRNSIWGGEEEDSDWKRVKPRFAE